MPVTVRDGQKVWPTCPECGCRLRNLSGFILTHFHNDEDEEHDARGCKCPLVNEMWEILIK
jgi:hypothetical protein